MGMKVLVCLATAVAILLSASAQPFAAEKCWDEPFFIEHKGVTNCGSAQQKKHCWNTCKAWADSMTSDKSTVRITRVELSDVDKKSGRKGIGGTIRWCKYRALCKCCYRKYIEEE